MATYTYLAADLRTNAVLGDLPLTGVTVDSSLNGVGSFGATLAVGDPRVTKIDPRGSTQTARTVIYIDRNGVLLPDPYIIWTRKYDSSSKQATLGGQTLWSYFRRRFIKSLAPFSQVDQLAIARAIIANAQAVTGGNVGVVLGSEVSGVLRDRTYYDYELKPVGEAVEELAAVNKGFDFRIVAGYDSNGRPAKQLILGYPQLGQTAAATPLVFEYGALAGKSNILSYSTSEDSTAQDTKEIATGYGDGPAALTSTATATALIDVGYPLLEGHGSYGDVVVQTTLDDHATADLAARQSPVSIPEFVVDPSADPAVGTYACGDYARFTVSDEWYVRNADGTAGYDKTQRITKLSLTCPDADQAEQVKVSCGETS